MSKGKKSDSSGLTKVVFCKKVSGNAHKRWNKRDKSERNYRGQGR